MHWCIIPSTFWYHHYLWQSESYLPRHHLCKPLCNSTTENLSYWYFLALVDIYHFRNHQHENSENQQQFYIQSAYLYGILVFGGLFLVIKKYGLRTFIYHWVSSFSNSTYVKHIFLKWSKLWKDTIFITLVTKIWTVKVPGLSVQCHTTHVISSRKILAHSRKVSVWGGIP